MDVVTFGETMILMTPMNQGSLDTVWQFQKGLAGAESNVAIALARLEHAVAWVSKLGADSFGRFIYNTLRGEGVDVSHVQFDATRPTGVFFKEFLGGGRTHAYYYRQNSAASQMHVDDIPLADFTDARYLVVTGITPALSALNRDTTFQCIEQAHHCGMHVVFDPNIRRKLWSLEEARPVLHTIASHADIVLPGVEEGSILTGHGQAPEIAQTLLNDGAQLVVVKLGPQGAYYQSATEKGYVAGFQVHMVDEVGAGDAFTAGLLSGLLDNLAVPAAVRRACALGALAVTGTGDYESLPYRHELDAFLNGVVDPGR